MVLILYYVVAPCQSTFTLIERIIWLLVSGVKGVADSFSVNAKCISGNTSLLTEYPPKEFIYRHNILITIFVENLLGGNRFFPNPVPFVKTAKWM